MRRENRGRKQNWWEDKKLIFSILGIAIALALVIAASAISGRVSNTDMGEGVSSNQIVSLAPASEIDNNTENASSPIGNAVEQSITNTTIKQEDKENNENTDLKIENKKEDKIKKEDNSKTIDNKKDVAQTNATPEKKTEIDFSWPVKGEIIKAFSGDTLLYSSTLQEWVAHNGIDIKADKTAVVTAVADGTVKSIKNDPRYGLTVIIEHENGFKTIYSNLLTAEFVVEGEKVKKSQTIGTVGNTANFEIADESHLHFEMMKDSEYIDPTIYLK